MQAERFTTTFLPANLSASVKKVLLMGNIDDAS
jgi:hypothetical protein